MAHVPEKTPPPPFPYTPKTQPTKAISSELSILNQTKQIKATDYKQTHKQKFYNVS